MGDIFSKTVKEGVEETNFFSPLLVFPEEIWLEILEYVTDSEDIYNTVEAFPELKRVWKRKSHIWLIDDVLPLILPKYLSFRDVKSFRLVCKRWNFAVESVLETLPDRLPYKSDRLSVMTKQHFNYTPSAIDFKTNFMRFAGSLKNVRKIGSRNYNPFPGRSVKLKMNSYYRSITPYLGFKTVTLLEQFGRCIWYMDIVLPELIEETDIVLTELSNHCLSHLVNLKSLKIKGYLPIQLKCNSLIAKIPAKLETLNLFDLTVENSNVCVNLITNLAWHRSVKKLAICTEHWNKKYSSWFPELAELQLRVVSADFLTQIKMILKQVQAPKLRKLHILNHPYANIYDILRILVPYKIESLVLRGPLGEVVPGEAIIVPSLLELNTWVHALLKYKFVESIPALQYLTVVETPSMETNKGCYDEVNMRLGKISFDPEDKVDNRKSIWEELPNLKFINLVDDDLLFCQYTREDKNTVFARESYPRLVQGPPGGSGAKPSKRSPNQFTKNLAFPKPGLAFARPGSQFPNIKDFK